MHAVNDAGNWWPQEGHLYQCCENGFRERKQSKHIRSSHGRHIQSRHDPLYYTAKYTCLLSCHGLSIHTCRDSSGYNNGTFFLHTNQKRNDQFYCNSWRRCSIKLRKSKADLADIKSLNIKNSLPSRFEANNIIPCGFGWFPYNALFQPSWVAKVVNFRRRQFESLTEWCHYGQLFCEILSMEACRSELFCLNNSETH